MWKIVPTFGILSIMIDIRGYRNRRPIWEHRRVPETPPQSSVPKSGAQTVERAIAILNLFRADRLSLGITEIARQAGLNLTTAHRLVRTLVHEQFMEQDPTNEQYRLGPALAVLGRRRRRGLWRRPRPADDRATERDDR